MKKKVLKKYTEEQLKKYWLTRCKVCEERYYDVEEVI